MVTWGTITVILCLTYANQVYMFLWARKYPSTISYSQSACRRISRASVLQAVDNGHKNLGDKLVYDRYRKLINRKIEYPTGKVVDFDVVSQGSDSITAFLWNTSSLSTILVREYHPGVQKVLYGVVAGMFESHKHSNRLECAQAEMEEEAQRVSGRWIPLLEGNDTVIPLEKYSDNEFTPYLVLDPQLCVSPKLPDNEELIEIVEDVSYDSLMKIIRNGEMNIASSFCALLALRKLEELGLSLWKR